MTDSDSMFTKRVQELVNELRRDGIGKFKVDLWDGSRITFVVGNKDPEKERAKAQKRMAP